MKFKSIFPVTEGEFATFEINELEVIMVQENAKRDHFVKSIPKILLKRDHFHQRHLDVIPKFNVEKHSILRYFCVVSSLLKTFILEFFLNGAEFSLTSAN